MALVDFISISIVDGSGDVKALPIYFPAGMTLANVQAGASALATALNDAIDGKIAAITYTKNLTVPGGLNAGGGGDIQRGALLSFNAENTVYKHGMFVPTVKDSLFTGDTPITDTGALATFISDVIAGMGTGGSELIPSDKYANDLTTLASASKRFRK